VLICPIFGLALRSEAGNCAARSSRIDDVHVVLENDAQRGASGVVG
jgi:hypothetical protein